MFFGRNIKSRFLSICWRYVVCLIAVPLSLVVFNTVAHSAQLTLAWSPNGEPDLAGYRVFSREQGQAYDFNDPAWEGWIDPGPDEPWKNEVDEDNPSCTIDLEDGATYCFVVRAFDTSENESSNSNEACWTPPTDVVLESLSISGPDSVDENTMSNYTATATFSDGSTQPATGSSSWSEGSSYASISGSGVLTTSSVNSDQTVTIVATYTFDVVTKQAQKVVVIRDVGEQPELVNLSISGPDSVYENTMSNYTATATFSDGSTQPATNSSSWSEGSSYASISGSGVLTTSSVSSNQTVAIVATYTFDVVTKQAQKEVTIVDIPGPNLPPGQPGIISPYSGEEDVLLTPELCAGYFSDPDGDAHTRTKWQVSKTNDFSSEASLILEVNSDSHLTCLTVPRMVLDEETTYYWWVRFCDSANNWSEWSEICSFKTQSLGDDVDPRNGIPDVQEVGADVDLDGNGVADSIQSNIKTVNTVVGDGQIAVKVAPGVSVEKIRSIDPGMLLDSCERPDEMPLGVIGFKVVVPNAGDSTEVSVYLSEAAPSDARWYKYDTVNGWQVHQLTVVAGFSDDRKTVFLPFEDGDYGDADGVKNGIIVDPGGVGLTYSSPSGTGGQDSGGGGGGCFVSAIIPMP